MKINNKKSFTILICILTILPILFFSCSSGSPGVLVDSKAITEFSFLASVNSKYLSKDVIANVTSNNHITASVPYGTNVTDLIATFTITGINVRVNGVLQYSGHTSNNFTDAVTYTVAAQDGSTQNYEAVITILPESHKEITSFSFLKSVNPVLSSNVSGVISSDDSIALTVPYGTNVTNLIATFTATGSSVSVGSVVQVSGTTSNDFTNALTYVVAAADSSTKNYIVTVTKAADDQKNITKFWFDHKNPKNVGLNSDVTATIDGTNITATIPQNADINLVASFTTTGTSVKVGYIIQHSEETQNDFTNPITYVVTDGYGATKNYTVTITKATGKNISLVIVNKCPAARWIKGHNAAGTPITPNDIKLESGASSQTFLVPVPWVSGNFWACPEDTTGKSTIGNDWFAYACQQYEATTGIKSGTTKNFMNIDITYVVAATYPSSLVCSGGECDPGSTVECSVQTTLANLLDSCPTKSANLSTKYTACANPGKICSDPDETQTFDYCTKTYWQSQVDVCTSQYPTRCNVESTWTAYDLLASPATSFFGTAGDGQKMDAALQRGVIALPESEWGDSTNYYTVGVTQNTFAAWVHNDIGCGIYAFPYDDTSSDTQSGDITCTGNDCQLTVTICPWN